MELENTTHELIKLRLKDDFYRRYRFTHNFRPTGSIYLNLKLCKISIYSIKWSKPEVRKCISMVKRCLLK